MKRSLGELAAAVGGEAVGDPALLLAGVAAPEEAGPTDVVFAESERHLQAALASRAGAIVAALDAAVGDRAAIRVREPKLAFARVAALFHPAPRPAAGVHPSAVVDRTAELGADVHVGPHATVEANAVVGPRAVVGPGCVVGAGARVGADSVLLARVVLYPGTVLGERVLVHAGAVLGSDGFGFVRDGARLVKFPQVGSLVVEDDVEIGANTTLDRGALGRTVIGRGTKIDNLVQVAHNVRVGPGCALSAQVGIAGSSVLGEGVTLAGQVGVADRVRIESGAVVGAQAGVPSGKRIPAGQVVWGTPARPLAEFKRQHAQLAHIGRLRERVEELLRRIGELEARAEDSARPGGS